MGGQHDKKKHQISVKFPHETWRRIEKAASAEKLQPSPFIRKHISDLVAGIELTDDDKRLVVKRIEQAKKEGRIK